MLLSQSDSSNAKRLSTIAESSTDSQVYKEMALIDVYLPTNYIIPKIYPIYTSVKEEMDSSASRYNSSHDIIV